MPKKKLPPYSDLFPGVARERVQLLLDNGVLKPVTVLVTKRQKISLRQQLATQDELEVILERRKRRLRKAGFSDEEIAAAFAVVLGEATF